MAARKITIHVDGAAMIALDSSSLIAYLGGEQGADVDAVELAFEQRQGVLRRSSSRRC